MFLKITDFMLQSTLSAMLGLAQKETSMAPRNTFFGFYILFEPKKFKVGPFLAWGLVQNARPKYDLD